jgi:hypothetical protein
LARTASTLTGVEADIFKVARGREGEGRGERREERVQEKKGGGLRFEL